MSDQEMQFADPAWRPSQQRDSDAGVQQEEPFVPRPVNVDKIEQPLPAQEQEEPYVKASYTGYRAQPVSGTTLRTRQRTRFVPWLWIVLALMIFLLMGGAFRTNFDRPDNFNMPAPFQFKADRETDLYGVAVHPTIVIKDLTGSITVHTGGSNDVVAVQTSRRGPGQVDVSRGANDTLNFTVDSADPSTQINLDVTVSNEADLVLQTSSGDITAEGVNGQVNLISDSGTINLSQDTLTRNSSAKTGSGDITLIGAIDSGGSSQFETSTGSVDLTLPSDSPFHADVAFNKGTFQSDFPEVSASRNDTTASGDVGAAPRANITIKTDDGSVSLHKE